MRSALSTAPVVDEPGAQRRVLRGDVVVVDAGQGPIRVPTDTTTAPPAARVLLGARPGQRVRWRGGAGPVLIRVIAIEDRPSAMSGPGPMPPPEPGPYPRPEPGPSRAAGSSTAIGRTRRLPRRAAGIH
jgi:hypothetical protein